jgi:serine/threonine-protein kinase
VVQQLARALGHAHEAGVIHRDLKPENVMVRDDGVLKLMDFGIARVLDPAERMTVTGALVGSPAYMAPEVIDGEPATPSRTSSRSARSSTGCGPGPCPSPPRAPRRR